MDDVQNARNYVNEIMKSGCVINGEVFFLDDIEKMGYDEFSRRSKLNMPLKLYKYFPNKVQMIKNQSTGVDEKINYSILSLKNNTVFLQSPMLFDDVYDSDINIDYCEYVKIRLLHYCKICKVEADEDMDVPTIGNMLIKRIYESIIKNINLKNSNDIFSVLDLNIRTMVTFENRTEMEKVNIELFIRTLEEACLNHFNGQEALDIGKFIPELIYEDYKKYKQRLINLFRVSCFSSTPYSQLMWGGSYADCHKGFCVEYTVLPDDEKYNKLYYNLFPMIYCYQRPNVAKSFAIGQDKELDMDLFWIIYFNGVLRKSMDWMYQYEWRLLLPFGKDENDFNVKFFPITKVYLGCRMGEDNVKEITQICNSQGIPFVRMMKNPNIFEMQEIK